MQEVSVIIPNYNGMAYLEGVLSSLEQQAFQNFETILVDNGSSDGSVAFVMGNFPWVHIVELPDNFGFSRAVNEGIYASRTPYVLLLNNDTEVDKNFVGEMLAAIKRHKKAFSCSARMICYHDRNKLDDAGNYYSALGWAYARGKGKDIHSFEKEGRIFASCAGAAIYRKKVFEKIGYFDEEHFAYLEDLDIGYRARIFGYQNWYAPKAKVLLMSPIYLGEKVWQEGYDQEFSRESVAVSRNLQSVYEKIAKERQIEFLPAAAYVHCCEADQEHLNASGHKEFAEVVYQKIRKFL